MELNVENMEALSKYLQQTLSHDATERRAAEKYLEYVEGNKNYALLLLMLVDNSDAAMHVRASAAITFKNFVKRNWRVVDDQEDKVHVDDRNLIRERIVELMLNSPESLQKQLSDAISIIGREDFPNKWPSLLTDMVAKIQSGNFHVINGVLRTAHSVFRRYRHEFKCDELWLEIKFVLDHFAQPLTDLLNETMKLVAQHSNNQSVLRVLFSSIVFICKIFNSLNAQDLPEFFEDNMHTWMGQFHTLLTMDQGFVSNPNEDEAGLMEQCKSQICENLAMYAQKYDEEFAPHLTALVSDVWNLLISCGQELKYDLLVSNAIQFLAQVAERPANKHLFADDNTINSICQSVVVPNIEFRSQDEEQFEDNPEEYIRRDIEGSDVDTRRRAACDLVRALIKQFEGPVIQNFSQYVQAMLIEYSKDQKANWKCKDTAIYLITTLAAKAQTQKHGITQTSELVNIVDFFKSNILPELEVNDVNSFPVLRADCIKYTMTFRGLLPGDVWPVVIPKLIHLLASSSYVVHSYSAHCLEKVFTIRLGNSTLVTKEFLEVHTQTLLSNLFGAMSHKGSEENEYIMKSIMRTLSILQEKTIPYVEIIVASLTEKLLLVAKNPSKPHFNHYLFESICLCIRNVCREDKSKVSVFEANLFPPFTQILQQDVTEFIPYVFQILSLMLEMHESAIPESYAGLYSFLLAPVLWERMGNVPPLVRLLMAYVEKGGEQIFTKLDGLLGVFQKLIASKTNDNHGFDLLSTIIHRAEPAKMAQYNKQIFVLLFQRLTSSKTTKYVKGLLVFFSFYCVQCGAENLISLIDSIQPKMFAMVVERLYILDVQKVSGSIERKICCVGITKILMETPQFAPGGVYASLWASLLETLVSLFELPEDDELPAGEHFIEVDDTEYSGAYSQLAFASKKERDIVQGNMETAKLNLAKQLSVMSTRHPGQLATTMRTSLQPDAQKHLQAYLTAANCSLA
ncbi:exportin-2-like [Watersipora subatra]|uniref:exportin-2-like n=1 Tax=Watersipora subatra TaxID=2589382 RepID=UPI00355BD513